MTAVKRGLKTSAQNFYPLSPSHFHLASYTHTALLISSQSTKSVNSGQISSSARWEAVFGLDIEDLALC